MATNSLQSLYHHHSLLRSLHSDVPPSTLSSSLFLKPTTTTSLSHSLTTTTTAAAFSLSSTTTTPSTSQTLTFDLLNQLLTSKNFRQADEETRRLLIALAGDAAQKRGYVFFSEVQFISETDLKTIDNLWRQHSNDKFGYSVQKKIWDDKADRDFTSFFIKVGWMKKLDTEIEQYNYRAFPNEFIWELTDETPVGHLPLTNALRGTQLLRNIFTHPAFEGEEEEEEDNGNSNEGLVGLGDNTKPLTKKVFTTDYSF